MGEVLWRFLWATCASGMVALASYVFLGSVLTGDHQASGKNVVAKDLISAGEHEISGTIPVPNECDGITVQVKETSPYVYQLDFKTWEEPYRDCTREPAVRFFHAVTFAPAIGSTFSATLDGKPIDIQLLDVLKKTH